MRIEAYKKLLTQKKKEIIKSISKSNDFRKLLENITQFLTENKHLNDVPKGFCEEDFFYALDISVRSYNVVISYLQREVGNKLIINTFPGLIPFDLSIKAVFQALSIEGLLASRNCGAKTIEDIKDGIKELTIALNQQKSQEDWTAIQAEINERDMRLREKYPTNNKIYVP